MVQKIHPWVGFGCQILPYKMRLRQVYCPHVKMSLGHRISTRHIESIFPTFSVARLFHPLISTVLGWMILQMWSYELQLSRGNLLYLPNKRVYSVSIFRYSPTQLTLFTLLVEWDISFQKFLHIGDKV